MNSLSHHSNNFVKFVIFLSIFLMAGGCKTSHSEKNKTSSKVETVNISKIKGNNNKIVEEAMTWLGTPYKYADSKKGWGTDCSGMVVEVYKDVTGKKLPRNSKQQADFCKKIKTKEIKPGDLAFFATGKDKTKISHVGIMIDNVQFIHASTKKGVVISDITTDYYVRTFIMYGRVPDED